jgi:hypothetical protein
MRPAPPTTKTSTPPPTGQGRHRPSPCERCGARSLLVPTYLLLSRARCLRPIAPVAAGRCSGRRCREARYRASRLPAASCSRTFCKDPR